MEYGALPGFKRLWLRSGFGSRHPLQSNLCESARGGGDRRGQTRRTSADDCNIADPFRPAAGLYWRSPLQQHQLAAESRTHRDNQPDITRLCRARLEQVRRDEEDGRRGQIPDVRKRLPGSGQRTRG